MTSTALTLAILACIVSFLAGWFGRGLIDNYRDGYAEGWRDGVRGMTQYDFEIGDLYE
jgi:hypothetical protein